MSVMKFYGGWSRTSAQMKKETIQLTYEVCVQQMERWQALGRNYTAVQKAEYRGPEGYHPAYVIFHSLDLVNVFTGIRIRVTEGHAELHVEFPPFGGRYPNAYSYPMECSRSEMRKE